MVVELAGVAADADTEVTQESVLFDVSVSPLDVHDEVVVAVAVRQRSEVALPLAVGLPYGVGDEPVPGMGVAWLEGGLAVWVAGVVNVLNRQPHSCSFLSWVAPKT